MEPRDGFIDDIIARIRKEKELYLLKRRIVIFSMSLISSALALWPALRLLESDLATSGFGQFISLAFSDSGMVAAYWQNFALAVLESMPVMSLAFFLAVVFMLLKSSQKIFQNLKMVLVTN